MYPPITLTIDDVSAAAGLAADDEDDDEEGVHADKHDEDDQAQNARQAAVPTGVAYDRVVACVQGKLLIGYQFFPE